MLNANALEIVFMVTIIPLKHQFKSQNVKLTSQLITSMCLLNDQLLLLFDFHTVYNWNKSPIQNQVQCRGGSRSWLGEGHKQGKLLVVACMGRTIFSIVQCCFLKQQIITS